MKKLKIGLLAKIIIAIAAGVLLGIVAPAWMVRIFITFNGIFSQFLGFAIPLIILGMVAPAISDIGKKAGKMLLVTVAIAYGSTIFAGLTSYLTGAALFPGMIQSRIVPRNDPERQCSSGGSGSRGIEPIFHRHHPATDECDDGSHIGLHSRTRSRHS